MHKATRVNRKIHIAVYVILACIIVSSLLAALEVTGHTHFFHPQRQTQAPTPTHNDTGINQSPATPEEKQLSEDLKGTPTPLPTPSNTSKQAVTVFITSSDPTNVRAYVQGVIEDGGTCTAIFTNGSVTETGVSSGISNASDTVCPAIQISGVTKGSWSLTYSYESKQYEGSTTKDVQL